MRILFNLTKLNVSKNQQLISIFKNILFVLLSKFILFSDDKRPSTMENECFIKKI